MSKSSPVLLVPLAALLLAGSALAQTVPSPNSSGADADRVSRRCTSSTLSTDTSAPCPDDVLNDGPRVVPIAVRPSVNSAPGSGDASAGTSTSSPGSIGTASMPGATGAGSVSAGGAAPTPARR